MINKSNIRTHILSKRSQLTAQQVQHLSQQVYRQILSTSLLNKKDNIASYCANSNEVNLAQLLDEYHNIYLPVIKPKHRMVFSKYTSPQELQKNKFGILEPTSNHVISAKEIRVCFVPLVAFNRQGVRLGMGGGYYDRYFQHNKDNKKPTKLVGIAYDFQESDTITAQSWDIPLDIIITNKEVITP